MDWLFHLEAGTLKQTKHTTVIFHATTTTKFLQIAVSGLDASERSNDHNIDNPKNKPPQGYCTEATEIFGS